MILGKSRRVGPTTMSLVATVSMTLSPITLGLPNTLQVQGGSRGQVGGWVRGGGGRHGELHIMSCAMRAAEHPTHSPEHIVGQQPQQQQCSGAEGAQAQQLQDVCGHQAGDQIVECEVAVA